MTDYESDLRYYAALYEEQGYSDDEALLMAEQLMKAVGVEE